MNMETYQNFMRLYSLIANRHEGLETIPNVMTKEKFYKEHLGVSSREEFEEMQEKRTRYMCARINGALDTAKFFEVDKIEKRLMLLTDSPTASSVLKKVRMPFPSVFLDIHIDTSEMSDDLGFDEVFGILLEENIIDEGRTIFVAFGVVTPGEDGSPMHSIYDLILDVTEGKPLMMPQTQEYFDRINNDQRLLYDKMGHATKRFFSNFLVNFALFLNHPDIEFLEVKRDAKTNERRVKKGRMPLPASSRIRLTGQLKRYTDSMGEQLSGDGFNHSFWVRGHYRTFTAERYKDARGKMIWVAPFIKGSGDMIDKTYSLEANDNDSKRYKQEFMFLDDVEAAESPLRERRRSGDL